MLKIPRKRLLRFHSKYLMNYKAEVNLDYFHFQSIMILIIRVPKQLLYKEGEK